MRPNRVAIEHMTTSHNTVAIEPADQPDFLVISMTNVYYVYHIEC